MLKNINCPLTELQTSYVIGRNEEEMATKVIYELKTESIELHRLERAMEKTIMEQPALNSYIHNSKLLMLKETINPVHVPFTDISSYAEDEKERHINNVLNELKRNVWDCKEGYPVTVSAVKMDENDIRIFLDFDMLIFDGMSTKLFLDKIKHYYDDPHAIPQVDHSFFDYCLSKTKLQKSKGYERAKNYWLSDEASLPPAPNISHFNSDMSAENAVFDRLTETMAQDEWVKIKENILAQGIQPYVLMLALYAKILALYSGSNHFTVNLPVTNRKAASKNTIGDFTSVLLIDVDVAQENISILCEKIQKKILKALKNRSFDGIEVMRNMAKREHSENAHFPIVFTPMLYDDFRIATDSPVGKIVRGCSQTTNVLLDCQIFEYDGNLSINIDYRKNSFDKRILDNMFKIFCKDIKRFSNEETFFDTEFLNKILDEDLEQIQSYNHTEEDIPVCSLMELAAPCFEAHKNKIAVSCGNETITFGELWKRSESVCRHLVAEGVKKGDTVAVIGSRRIATIVNILGVFRCGAVYVPIDTVQPEDRRNRIIQKANCRCVITEKTDFSKAFTACNNNINCTPDDIAYIIFTSGSTGEPKGVVIRHSAAINTVLDINKRYHVTDEDVLACVSSIGFDLSIYDIFSCFTTGAELALIPDVYDVEAMVSILSDRGVTVWNSVPAIFRIVVDYLSKNEEGDDSYFGDFISEGEETLNYILSLRLVMLSGDWISKNVTAKAMKLFTDCRMVSLGGATEASIWSIYYNINQIDPKWDSIPYGYPLSNQKIYILDNRSEIAPIGAKGEICIGGAGVAEGYFNDPQKTEAQFRHHKKLGKIYHTGDYGLLSPERYVVFLGRKDHQIKINGFRIELGEVENAIKKLDYVKNAVAVVRKAKSGSQAICAYVSLYKKADAEQIIKDSAEKLPHYMIPSRVVIMDDLPLTANGKIDRKNLPDPFETTAAFVSAETNIEKKLTELWKKHLKTDAIPVDGHFIELGGDSLAMITIVNEIKEQFGIEISFKKFMILGSIRNIAAYIRKDSDNAPETTELVYSPVRCSAEDKNHAFPLTDIQFSYFIGRNSGIKMGSISTHAYYEVENNFDILRLNQALNRVIANNPMLRMVVTADGKQKILEHVEEYVIPENDISSLSPEEQEKELMKARDEHSHKIIDITSFPLFEFYAIRRSPEKVRLLVGFDLLIADGISMRIFIRQLMENYDSDGASAVKADFDFHDYILSLNAMKETSSYEDAKQYWESQLEHYSGAPSLPVKAAAKDIRKPVFKRCKHVISAEIWNPVKETLAKYNITPSTFLMTIYGRLLAYYSNRDHVTLNVTTFSRFPFDEAVNTMIGDFTSVMLVEIDGKNPCSDVCRSVQEKIAENLAYKLYDGVSVIRSIAKKENRNGELLFPYVFTSMLFENQDAFNIDDVGDVVYSVSQTSQVCLDCQVMNQNQGISITWDYVSQLFDSQMMEKIFAEYIDMIQNAADFLSGKKKSYLSEHDKKVIKAYNLTQKEYPAMTLIAAFEKTVAAIPDKKAVTCMGKSVTYSELNKMAENIAGGLKERGIHKGDRVAVYEYRNAETIAVILGILKCGAVYVPISPSVPSERKKFILENSGISAEITIEETEKLLLCSPVSTTAAPSVNDEAYIIYTSGSTGRPKGVVMTHGGAMNTIADINSRFGIDEKDVILGVSSFTFDLSVYDIFGAFSSGAELVLAQDSKNVQELKTLISDASVTVWNSVPAIFSLIINDTSNATVDYFDEAAENIDVVIEDTDTLRIVMLSGDYIPTDLPDKIKAQYSNAEVISLGGATEGGIWSIYYPIRKVDENWSVIPYGYPLSNQQMYVLDKNNEICPLMLEGEIAIGGNSLSLGYCNDPKKTNAAFLHHPVLGRIYKTGDMGAFHPDGYMEFHGRKDNQVKINGYRIELGEIESALLKIEGISAAAAVISANHKNNILAFYVSERKYKEAEIRRELEKQIPSYMLPPVIKPIAQLPVTANGKIDRKKLSSENLFSKERTVLLPRTENEKLLYKYFSEAIGIENFSITDSFFELGGDSIKGIAMFNKLSEEYDIALNLIFRYQTVEQLAAHLKKRNSTYIDERMDKFRKEYYSVSEDNSAAHVEELYAAYLETCSEDLKKYRSLTKVTYSNILLTGATGYLGAYLAERLLAKTNAMLYLTVRGNDPEKRLHDNLLFYFNRNLLDQYSDRIHYVSCDLSKPFLGMSEEAYQTLSQQIDLIINCAGKVQHFGKHEDFKDSNVESVKNLICLCKNGKKKRLCHLSTTRVSENLSSEDGIVFSEYTCADTELSEEYYVQTKKEAEDILMQAIQEGLAADIYRIGTVLFDSHNGHFQKNIASNSFYLIMKSFFELGAMPDINAELLDFSFVDQCAEAILSLVMVKETAGGIYHIFNPYKLSMRSFYEKLKSCGMTEQMDIMEFEEFFDFVYDKYKDEDLKEPIDTLLLHAGTYLSVDSGICTVVNDKTCELLEKCGFKWSEVHEKHISDMLEYGKKINFFRKEM